MGAYVPIDLHRHRSVVMHMADDGEVLGWTRLPNDPEPETLLAEVLQAGEAPEVAIEATYGWYWAVDALAAAGANVHLVAPSKLTAFEGRRVKNDQRDSRCSGICCTRGCCPRRGSPRRRCGSGANWCAIGPSSCCEVGSSPTEPSQRSVEKVTPARRWTIGRRTARPPRPAKAPPIPAELRAVVAELAIIVVRARSAVSRDRNTREIEMVSRRRRRPRRDSSDSQSPRPPKWPGTLQTFYTGESWPRWPAIRSARELGDRDILAGERPATRVACGCLTSLVQDRTEEGHIQVKTADVVGNRNRRVDRHSNGQVANIHVDQTHLSVVGADDRGSSQHCPGN